MYAGVYWVEAFGESLITGQEFRHYSRSSAANAAHVLAATFIFGGRVARSLLGCDNNYCSTSLGNEYCEDAKYNIN
jgi:hypothetical protein